MRIFYPVFCEENGHRPAVQGGQKIFRRNDLLPS